MVGAELRADMIDEKRASIVAASTAAPEATVPRQSLEMEHFPTAEEMASLRRVANTIPPRLFTIAFVELCERFSYYGSTAVCE